MAQGNVVSISEKDQAKMARDATLARKFFDFEGQVCDLCTMARIADHHVSKCLNELKCVDGQPIEPPSGEDVEAAVFAVGHLFEMIQHLKAEYFKTYDRT